MNIGKQIKQYRLQKPARQEELADFLGVSCQAVSKWETEASLPDITLLPRIAIYFGITIDALFRISDEEELDRIENALCMEHGLDEPTFQYYGRFLNRLIDENPNNTRAHIDLAGLYNHRSYADHRTADACARKALALEPGNKRAWSAFLEANNGRCGDEWLDNHFTVIEFCKSVLEKHPDNYRGLYAIIENLLNDDRFDEAAVYVEGMGRLPGHNDQYELYQGDICFGKGQREQALEHWHRAVHNSPNRWQAYCGRADRLKKLGRYEEALEDYEQCFRMQKPGRITDGLHSRAQLFEQLGQHGRAIEERRRILQSLAEDWDCTEGEGVNAQMREIERLQRLADL